MQRKHLIALFCLGLNIHVNCHVHASAELDTQTTENALATLTTSNELNTQTTENTLALRFSTDQSTLALEKVWGLPENILEQDNVVFLHFSNIDVNPTNGDLKFKDYDQTEIENFQNKLTEISKDYLEDSKNIFTSISNKLEDLATTINDFFDFIIYIETINEQQSNITCKFKSYTKTNIDVFVKNKKNNKKNEYLKSEHNYFIKEMQDLLKDIDPELETLNLIGEIQGALWLKTVANTKEALTIIFEAIVERASNNLQQKKNEIESVKNGLKIIFEDNQDALNKVYTVLDDSINTHLSEKSKIDIWNSFIDELLNIDLIKKLKEEKIDSYCFNNIVIEKGTASDITYQLQKITATGNGDETVTDTTNEIVADTTTGTVADTTNETVADTTNETVADPNQESIASDS